MKEIMVEFSSKDMKDVEKIPGFNPIWTYPKLDKMNPRVWGYLIKDNTIYFFRVKNEEETIKDMVEHYFRLKLLTSGIQKLAENGNLNLDEISKEMKPIIDLCDIMVKQYSELVK